MLAKVKYPENIRNILKILILIRYFCSIFVQFHSDIKEFLILHRRYIVIISSSLINEVSYVNLMYSNSRHHFRTVHHSFRWLFQNGITKIGKMVKNLKFRIKEILAISYIDFLCRYLSNLALKCTIGFIQSCDFIGKIWAWSLVKNTLAG